MTETPLLSICVPSRNRQDTFRQTILDLIASTRTDVEFVFADNSDEPAIMDGFIATIDDPRVRYLSSPAETLPMQDNWERTIEATSGDWIIFIGDDDYVDPDTAGVIAEILARAPDTEAVAWNKPGFKWPSYRPFAGNFSFSLRNDVRRSDRSHLIRRMLLWERASYVPSMPYTVYHGAVSRPAMDRMKRIYGGRYFEHPTVDYDCGNRLLFSAKSFVFVSRPLSILGATEKSNSSAVGRFAKALQNYQNFVSEKGSRFESDGAMADFPFKSNLGVASSIMSGQHWFKTTHGVVLDGWQENFVRALARDCSRAIDRQEFDLHTELCRRAVTAFEGGRFLDAFKPTFTAGHASIYTGMNEDELYVSEDVGGCQTPAELYRLIQSILAPISDLRYQLDADGEVQAA